MAFAAQMPHHAISVRNTFVHLAAPATPSAGNSTQQPVLGRSHTAPVPKFWQDEVNVESDDSQQPTIERIDTQDSFGSQPNLGPVTTHDAFDFPYPTLLGRQSSQNFDDDTPKKVSSFSGVRFSLDPVEETRMPNRSPTSRSARPSREDSGNEGEDGGEQPSIAHCDTHNPFESDAKWFDYGGMRAAPQQPQQPTNPQQSQLPAFTVPSQLSAFTGPLLPWGVMSLMPAVVAPPVGEDSKNHASAGADEKIPFQKESPQERPKKQQDAQRGATPRTTVMLRNLPNNYTRDMLVALLNSKGFLGAFDFLYLPMDFRTHAAMGYAFINMVTAEDAQRLHRTFDGFVQWAVPSSKRCCVSWSDPYQGFDSNMQRYRNSPLMHDSVPDHFRPILFKDGLCIPFPLPTKKTKPPRQGTERMLV
mmetsp:Transcript_41424/g.118488  ORF Transcript_41424/g.118488 Transcript_41424/m.118488 type:complete len:418 (-) Transcript_41424:353-1606(-)